MVNLSSMEDNLTNIWKPLKSSSVRFGRSTNSYSNSSEQQVDISFWW